MVRTKAINASIFGILLCSSIVGFMFTESCSAEATTIYIDDSNTGGPWDGTQLHPYQHINDGITAANPGDTVFVSSGTYTENILITKNLTLTGESKDITIIDGDNCCTKHVLYIDGSDTDSITAYISGFTLRKANGSGFDCIHCSYVTNGEITNNKIMNSIEGEGIQLDHCQGITINNNLISGNKISAGISVVYSEQNIIKNNNIQDNQMGIDLSSYSNSNEITGNTIRDNIAYGVRIVQSSNNVFSHNDFTRNYPNAQDPSSNEWSTNGQGNYWDDYTGYDNNSDGIGDIPYTIPGGTNKDYYPLGYFQQTQPPENQNQIPIAYAPSITPSIAYAGELVTLSGDGTDTDGIIVGYSWRSNLDGVLSTQQSFSTKTLSVGTHTIYFKILDNAGAWSSEQTASVTINAKVSSAPTAFIDDITPNPAKFGQAVLFHGHGSSENSTISAYQWFSNKDGVFSTAASCIVTNLTSGTHLIYFKVKDDLNQWSLPAAMTLVIGQNASVNPSNQAPVANIGGPYHGGTNESITFNASQSHDSDGTIYSYVWSFGDNTSGTGASPTHCYVNPGSYQVTVLVTDNDGATSQTSTTADIILSSSQDETSSGNSGFTLAIPFPVIVVAMIISIVIIFGMFIHWMKKR